MSQESKRGIWCVCVSQIPIWFVSGTSPQRDSLNKWAFAEKKSFLSMVRRQLYVWTMF